MTYGFFRLRTLAVLALLLLSACGGLAGEPRIVETLPPATPLPTEVGYPAEAPDLAVGAQIYIEHCIRCHGAAGKGDGELIGNGENQVPQVPPDFTDPATTAEQSPLDWFTTITNGRIDKLMPPWRDTLSESERWAVAMYTYTLHIQSDALVSGEALLKDQAFSTASLPPQADLVNLTDTQLLQAVNLSAAFLGGLSDAQKLDIAAYLRSLTLSNTAVIGQAVAPEPATTPEAQSTTAVIGTVSGQVTNGTAAGAVPAGLKATLHIFDAQFNDDPHETTVDESGRFTYENIPLQADRSYIVTVSYQDRLFPSDFLTGDPQAGKLDLPVKIYELTSDASAIRIVGWVTQISAVDGALQIAQVVSFTNPTDKAYSLDRLPGDDRYASVLITLPEGAQVLSVAADDQRYVLASDGRTVVDTAPVMPGEQHIAHVVYSLPYSGDLVIEQPVGYSLEGPVRLLVTPDSTKIISDQLPFISTQALSGVNYQAYGADLTLSAGASLGYTVQGVVTAGNNSPEPNNPVSLVLIAIGIIAILLAIFLTLRGRNASKIEQPSSDSGVLIDGLIREIAELDQLHTSGELDDTTYQNRRTKLKARLAELMDEE